MSRAADDVLGAVNLTAARKNSGSACRFAVSGMDLVIEACAPSTDQDSPPRGRLEVALPVRSQAQPAGKKRCFEASRLRFRRRALFEVSALVWDWEKIPCLSLPSCSFVNSARISPGGRISQGGRDSAGFPAVAELRADASVVQSSSLARTGSLSSGLRPRHPFPKPPGHDGSVEPENWSVPFWDWVLLSPRLKVWTHFEGKRDGDNQGSAGETALNA